MKKKKRAEPWVLWIFAAQIACLLLYSCFRKFDHDEFEFIHTAWLLSQGQVAFVDFFQHHHILAHEWASAALRLMPEKFEVVLLFRFLFFVNAVLASFLCFKLARHFEDAQTALFSSMILMGSYLFFDTALLIRPDPIMTSCLLVGVLFYFRYWQNANWLFAAVSVLLFSISFLVLQKAIIFLFCLGLTQLWLWRRRELSFRSLLTFWPAFFCLSAAGLWWQLDLSWSDYYFWNWELNRTWGRRIAPLEILKWLLLTGLTITLSFVALWHQVRIRQVRVLSMLSLFLALSILLYPNPNRQYFLPLMPFLAILAASGVTRVCRNPVLIKGVVGLAALGALVPILLFYALGEQRASRLLQEERIRYVLKNTAKEDLVFDGDIQVNLFRRSPHFFWFSIRPESGGVAAYSRHRRLEFEPSRIINESQPKFVFDRYLDAYGGDWSQNYRETKFEGLWRRVEDPQK